MLLRRARSVLTVGRAAHGAYGARPLLLFRRTLAAASSGGSGSSSKLNNTPLNTWSEEQLDADGRVLYEGSQQLTCRVMLSAATFNLAYWSYYLVTCAYYEGVVIEGIKLGGDPRWGFAGAFATGLMFYASQQYAHHAALKCYETADGERLGFQMHTIFGQPGRKIECRIGNAYLGERRGNFGSSYIPVRVKGVNRNVLVDDTCNFFVEKKEEGPRLFQLLKMGAEAEAEASLASPILEKDKERRIQWTKGKGRKGQKSLVSK
jgi:hypothetical protein